VLIVGLLQVRAVGFGLIVTAGRASVSAKSGSCRRQLDPATVTASLAPVSIRPGTVGEVQTGGKEIRKT
jgi:hypothetical protein